MWFRVLRGVASAAEVQVTVNTEQGVRARRSGMRDLSAQAFPLGVLAMRVKNREEVGRRREEMRALGLPELRDPRAAMSDFVELCGYYEKVFPQNAEHWKRAAEYARAEAIGPAAVHDQTARWGFVRGAEGAYEVPDWWSGRVVVPLEYMDYHPDRHSDDELRSVGVDPRRFHALGSWASDTMWMGYYLAKGALLLDGVSLLVKEVIDAARAFTRRVQRPRSGPLPIYVIGISEDEVAALRSPDVAVVGFNMGLSTVMERLVRNGQVRRLVAERDGDRGRLVDAVTREPVELQGGECYVCSLNAASGALPVPDQSGVVMTNETLHHNTYPDQAEMIRAMHRAALPVEGGRAWVAGELFRVANLPRVLIGLATMCDAPSWDAWVSFVNGIACVEELKRRREEWCDEGVELHFTSVPRGLARAPGFVHRVVMCQTQTLISGAPLRD